MKIADYIAQELQAQGRKKIWLANELGMKEGTLHSKINRDNLDAYDLVRIAAILNIDLNEFKKEAPL